MNLIKYNTKPDKLHIDTSLLNVLLLISIFLVSVCAIIIFLPSAGITNTITQTSPLSTSPNVPVDPSNTVIPDSITGVITNGYTDAVPVNPDQQLLVMVSLNFNNQQELNTYLTAVQNPLSPQFHQFLTKQQFYDKFSPSSNIYNSMVNYFQSQGLKTTMYTDRIAIQLQGTAAQFQTVFHTQLMNVQMGNKTFYAPVKTISLDTSYASQIAFIDGLSNRYQASFSQLFTQSQAIADAQSSSVNTSPTPLYSNNPTFCSQYLGYNSTNNLTAYLPYCSNQLLVGSDLQTGYQLTQLYQKSNYATNAVIATILWTGQDPKLQQVAPFVPSDINNYFVNTLPSGQPIPHASGDPILGAPAPGPSAVNDTYGGNFESTLDMEMIGSMAPGANIIEVYGPGINGSVYTSTLDAAFAEILNPASNNQTINQLLNKVSVISNSWGSFDDPLLADVLWQQYSQETAALGITVLAASGDNGNSQGNGASFPADEGYNNYGTIAVGGTQTYVTGNAPSNGVGVATGILNQTAWFNTPRPFDGSQGGISLTYTEPSWQLNSPDANAIIHASEPLIFGRGTPDIAAVGSNMNITISYNTFNSSGVIIPGKSYTNRMLPIWGTSVASPLAAGVIAVMDNYLGTREGFFAPIIYQLGEDQYTGHFSASLPFNDVSVGSNGFFNTLPGYDLVTGWGSINAYNFVTDQQAIDGVVFTETGLPNGTAWSVTVGDLTLTSTSNTISFMEPDGTYFYGISPVDGYSSSIVSNLVTINGNIPQISVVFQASTTQGIGANYVFSIVNTTSHIYYDFGLPMSQGFITGRTLRVPVDYISLYLNGTGEVYVSMGSFAWGSDILSPISIPVISTQHWYTITFPLIFLNGGGEQFFINVQAYSGNVQWGYADSTVTPPTTAQGNGVNYNTHVGLYAYSAYDFTYAALYAVGVLSSPPTLVSPGSLTYNQGHTGNTLSWYAFDTIYPYTYNITRNNVLISSGSWQVGIPISINVDGLNGGKYNYTIVVTDQLGAISWDSVIVTVKGSGSTPGFEFIPLFIGLLVLIPILKKNRKKNN